MVTTTGTVGIDMMIIVKTIAETMEMGWPHNESRGQWSLEWELCQREGDGLAMQWSLEWELCQRDGLAMQWSLKQELCQIDGLAMQWSLEQELCQRDGNGLAMQWSLQQELYEQTRWSL
jgi:hypothetical protein